MLYNLFNPHLFATCIEKISQEIYTDVGFQLKCHQKFNEIVYVIENGFKDTLGLSPTIDWGSQITNPENRTEFSRTVSREIFSDNIIREILLSISSEKEFEDHLRKKTHQIINDDKLITKVIVDSFISFEESLPSFLYENDRMKRFLYGNFSLNF